MRVLVDTNILLYAINTEALQHETARPYLDALLKSGDPWCLTWVNIYEFLSYATHPRCVSRPLSPKRAWDVVRLILAHPRLELLVETEKHPSVLEHILENSGNARGAFFHDCHIAALMQEHDVPAIATADTDFHKFRFLKVIDPTRP